MRCTFLLRLATFFLGLLKLTGSFFSEHQDFTLIFERGGIGTNEGVARMRQLETLLITVKASDYFYSYVVYFAEQP